MARHVQQTAAPLTACLLLALAAVVQTATTLPKSQTVTLASLKPPQITLSLKFMEDGKLTSLTPCSSQNVGNACLPKVQAADNSSGVVVSYKVAPSFKYNPATDFVQLKGCYSNFSQVDRPWRATKPVIAKSKKCPFVIKSNLPVPMGNATWHPKDVVPIATYLVRAFVLRNETGQPAPYQVAFGDSTGYFQVNPIDPRPKGMKIAAGICACVGPTVFTVYFILTYLRKKNV